MLKRVQQDDYFYIRHSERSEESHPYYYLCTDAETSSAGRFFFMRHSERSEESHPYYYLCTLCTDAEPPRLTERAGVQQDIFSRVVILSVAKNLIHITTYAHYAQMLKRVQQADIVINLLRGILNGAMDKAYRNHQYHYGNQQQNPNVDKTAVR